MDVAEFIAKHYYHSDTYEAATRARKLLGYPGVFFAGLPDDGLVLVYLTLSDEGLELLKNVKTEEDFKKGFSETLLTHPGHHIYVFRMVSKDRPTLRDLRRLRTQIIARHNAKTFSWHDDHHIILHTYEV